MITYLFLQILIRIGQVAEGRGCDQWPVLAVELQEQLCHFARNLANVAVVAVGKVEVAHLALH